MLADRNRMTEVERVIADARTGTWASRRRAVRLAAGLDVICYGRSSTAARIRREIGHIK